MVTDGQLSGLEVQVQAGEAQTASVELREIAKAVRPPTEECVVKILPVLQDAIASQAPSSQDNTSASFRYGERTLKR